MIKWGTVSNLYLYQIINLLSHSLILQLDWPHMRNCHIINFYLENMPLIKKVAQIFFEENTSYEIFPIWHYLDCNAKLKPNDSGMVIVISVRSPTNESCLLQSFLLFKWKYHTINWRNLSNFQSINLIVKWSRTSHTIWRRSSSLSDSSSL